MTSPEGRLKVPNSIEEMAVISQGYVPRNTRKNTDWAMRVLTTRRAEWNLRDPRNYCLEDLVEKPDVGKLNYWLCRFVTEVQKKDGQTYLPKSIQRILAGLQRKMLTINPDAVKFLDSSQCVFHELRQACDTIYLDLHLQRIGATLCHTPTFSSEKENVLWSARVLGCATPKSLQ